MRQPVFDVAAAASALLRRLFTSLFRLPAGRALSLGGVYSRKRTPEVGPADLRLMRGWVQGGGDDGAFGLCAGECITHVFDLHTFEPKKRFRSARDREIDRNGAAFLRLTVGP